MSRVQVQVQVQVFQPPVYLALQLGRKPRGELDSRALGSGVRASCLLSVSQEPTWEKSLCTKTFLQLAWERVVVWVAAIPHCILRE